MDDINSYGDILNLLSFTNKELAEQIGLSESAIKKIRSGKRMGSKEVQRKIRHYIMKKVWKVNKALESNGSIQE